jgi:hypothetical protein
MFAFLFLTYDNIYFLERYKKFLKNQNVYIHPKFPDKVDPYFQKNIISQLVETWWGNPINAMVKLLEEAYNNEQNEWFIMLSQDSYPLYNQKNFIKKFNEIQNDYNLSIFDYKFKMKNFWKTTTWCTFNRQDTKVIIDNHEKFYKTYNANKLDGTPDEFYFLTLLQHHVPNYKFITCSLVYDRWLYNVFSIHPIVFNKLTMEDIKLIKQKKSLFIRKTNPHFNIKPYILKNKMLFIVIIGSHTKQDKIEKFLTSNKYDFIIISFIDMNINIWLKENALHIIPIFYQTWMENIIDLIISYKKILQQWSDGLLFISESANIENIYMQNKKFLSMPKKKLEYIPYHKFSFKKNTLLTDFTSANKDIKFYHIKDDNNKFSYYINKKSF